LGRPARLRALLIDLDGVVRLWSPGNDRRAEEAAGLPAGAIRRAAFTPELLQPAITGRVPDPEWRRRVAERLRADFPAADADLAVRLWSESVGEVDAEVLGIVRACRGGRRVVLVTNATTRLPDDLRRLGLAEAWDAVVNSAEVGAAKPDTRAFAAALRAAAVDAAEALFVDDSTENVAAAEALGIPAHVHRGAGALREALRRAGWSEDLGAG